MASICNYSADTIKKNNNHFTQLKSTVEAAFYSINTHTIYTLQDAYNLAVQAPQTIILDTNVKHATDLGLDPSAKVLLTNDGGTVGRTAKARRIVGEDPSEDERLMAIIRDAIYQASFRPFI